MMPIDQIQNPPTALVPNPDTPWPRGGPVLALDCETLIGRDLPFPLTQVHHHKFMALCCKLLAQVAPSCIVLPLFAPGYDAAMAIERLEMMHFAGQIIVLAPFLPHPRMVEDELRALCPGGRLVLIAPSAVQVEGLPRR